MSRKNHAPGAGGGKQKGRSAGDQQTGGVTGGKLGGTNPMRYHTDAPDRAKEAGHSGGEQMRDRMESGRQSTDSDEERLHREMVEKGQGNLA